MKSVYEQLGVNRQLHFYYRQKQAQQAEHIKQIRTYIQSRRIDNSRIGLKKLYHQMVNCPVGRDEFIRIAVSLGLGVKPRKNKSRTTISVYTVFENIIAGKTFNNINQVWVSDITYLKIKNDDAYIVFILDIYSKFILGYNASLTLAASENIKALKMAFHTRKKQRLDGLIHHSDRGSQYIAGDYILMLYDKNIKISMCDCALDNAYAERVNGIIKNEYLNDYSFESLTQLQKQLRRAVEHYNTQRPHWALKLMTPDEFESHLENLTESQRTKLTIAQVHT